MKVVIRTDSSVILGSGHLMRCLTLASFLRGKGASVHFISRDLPGNYNTYLIKQGYTVHNLPYYPENEKAVTGALGNLSLLGESIDNEILQVQQCLTQMETIDYLIVDHYSLDYQWQMAMQAYVGKIMVIDDLADRCHACHLLLDQNYIKNYKVRYADLVPSDCTVLAGPQYALLRPEFQEMRARVKPCRKSVRRVLIFLGGHDLNNITKLALESVMSILKKQWHVDVVVGGNNPHRLEIETMCRSSHQLHFYCQIDNISMLMANADLCIGAAGVSTLERCCLGLPTVAIEIANNQQEVASHAHFQKLLINLGMYKQVDRNKLTLAIKQLAQDHEMRLIMQAKGLKLVDGLGCQRVVDALCN